MIYKAGGVSGATKSGLSFIKADNNFHDNEQDICNFGKGGTFSPTSRSGGRIQGEGSSSGGPSSVCVVPGWPYPRSRQALGMRQVVDGPTSLRSSSR